MSLTFGELVGIWFEERGLVMHSNPKKQITKLLEEVDELVVAINNGDLDEFKDAVGDICVVLAGMSRQYNVTFEECLDIAWNEIKDRKGHMNEEGIFVKDS